MKRDPIYLVIPIHGTSSVAKFADPNDAADFTEKLVNETGVSHTIFEAKVTCVADGCDTDKEFESVKPVQENACKGRDCPCHGGDPYYDAEPYPLAEPSEAPKPPKEIATIDGFLSALQAVSKSRELADELVLLVKSIEHPAIRATFKKNLLSFLTSELGAV
jgi:hypothetical protein